MPNLLESGLVPRQSTCHAMKAQMVVYPLCEDDSILSSASLETILEDVQLAILCARSGGLDTTRDW